MILASATSAGPHRLAAAGFTLFELVVVLIIISVLVGVFFHRFSSLQETTERAAMELTATSVRSALDLQMAALLMSGRGDEMSALIERNPMSLFKQPQANYSGEFDEPESAGVPRGSWYFDRKRKQLVYLVATGDSFVPDSGGIKRVRFQVVRKDGPKGGAGQTVTNETWGLTLRAVEPYQWVIK
jgi:prepilin-type N-terminal cleavage/methylation domain-containing protein